MKTVYNQLKLLKLLKLPALIFFMLALSYNVRAQHATPGNPHCYGSDINIFACPLSYCDSAQSTYKWFVLIDHGHGLRETDIFTGSYYDPTWNPSGVAPTWHPASDLTPHGDSYKNPVLKAGDYAYDYISTLPISTGDQVYLSIRLNVPGEDPRFSAGSVNLKIYAPINIAGVVTHIACNGASTGSITTTITGGSGTYAGFLWSNGATTQSLSGIPAGTYTLNVTDNNSCTASKSFTVTQPAAFTLASAITHANCAGAATGSVSLTPSGGSTPYSYNWSNGGTTSSISNLVAGTYSVTVTDAGSCSVTGSYSVTAPTAIVVTPTPNAPSCFNGTNGSITLSVTGGTPSYTYLWNGGSTNQNRTGIGAGTYSVTVTDSKGCTKTASVSVTQPTVITVVPTVTNANCNGGGGGSITLSVSGGTPGYSYLWNNAATTKDITGIPAGTYTVTVTDSQGCTTTSGGTVSQPPAMVATVQSITHVKCNGDATGSVYISVAGGTPGYSYLWNNAITTQNLLNVYAGTYTVTVTDSKGCTSTTSGTITQPGTLPQYQAVITNVACKNNCSGAIDVTPMGGTPGYTYRWSNGSTLQNLNNLCTGLYVLTLTDANGCNAISSNSVTEPAAVLTASAVPTNPNCNGGNGSIDVSVAGGTPSYSYHWNNGTTTEDLGPIGAGTYTLTVTDSHGCTTVTGGTITQPTALSISNKVITHVKCTGDATGSINITVTGGTPGYTYLWNNARTTQNMLNVYAGTYTVTVTDSKGCTTTTSGTITEPGSLPQYQAVITNVACKSVCNGAIDVTPMGGTPGYTYRWSNGSTLQNLNSLCAGLYVLTLTDANGCNAISSNSVTEPAAFLLASAQVTNPNCNGGNGSIDVSVSGGTPVYSFHWNNGTTTEDLGPIGAGTYTLTVTDSHGCTTVTGGTITQPAALTISNKVITHVKCTGDATGSINITVAGGTPGYTYLWNNARTTQNLLNVYAGTYTVTVTDTKGCTTTTSGTITEPGSLPQYQAVITNVACKSVCNGAIDVTPMGGTPGYTYRWSNGSTLQNLNSLCAGLYVLTLTDANGCNAISSNSVTEPAAFLLASAQVTNPNCNGGNGSIDVSVSGGTPVYSFHWNNGTTTEDLGPIGAGTYTLTVTDSHGCTTVTGGTITQPAALTISNKVITHVKCTGDATGAINITVAGGTPGYTYLWSNAHTTQNLANVYAGTYTVTVTDTKGCTTTTSATITEPGSLPQYQAVITNVNCFSSCNGAIDVTPMGGTPGYTYRWSNGSTLQNLNSLCAGLYVLTLTDANGCNAISSNNVTEPNLLVLTNANVIPVTCYGGSDGSICVTPSGGTPAYTYAWSTGSTVQPCLTGLTAGMYTLTVTDSHGCTAVNSWNVTQPPAILLDAQLTHVNCYNQSNGAINLIVTNGVSPFTYLWSNGNTGEDLSGIPAGTYTVLVTDVNNCTATGSWTITQPDEIVLTDVTIHHVTCNGGNDGSICVTPHGGTPGYTYAWSTGYTQGECIDVLIAGTYCVTVTDSHQCTATACWTITEPPAVDITGVITHVPCYGGVGSIDATVNVGVAPFTYLWSDGSTNEDLTGVPAGTYGVRVWDAHQCTDTASWTITQPEMLTVSLTLTHNHCYTYHEGTITTLVAGGTPDYTYLWSNGEVTPNLADLPAGTYTVTVTDAHGCTTTGVGTITEPEPWRPCISGPTIACQGSTKTYCICPNEMMRQGSDYEWTVIGGTLVDGCCGICKTIIWDHCTTGRICVTETRHDGIYNGCVMTTCIDVTLIPVPTPVITGPLTVYPDSTSVYTTAYNPCYLYSWSVIGGTITAGMGTNTISVLWNQCGPCDPGQVKVCVTDVCMGGLNEGFEAGNFPPTGWSQIITNTTEVYPGFNTWSTWYLADLSVPLVGSHSGTNAAAAWWSWTAQDEWLIAHNVRVSGNLEFWSYALEGWSTSNHYYVKVSPDHGATWIPLFDLSAMPYTGVWNEWNYPYTVDLSAYLGQVVDIAWQIVGDNMGSSALWAIDDISVGGMKIATNTLGGVKSLNQNTQEFSLTQKGDRPASLTSGNTGSAHGPLDYINPALCCGCATLDITILASPAPKIQGYVKYKNDVITGGFPTALNGVEVKLWNAAGNIVGTCTTGPNFNSLGEPGYFAFSNVPNGNYHLTASFNGTWGGNNATDALIVQLNLVGSYPLHGLDSIVADVNGSMTTTALDALYIKLRTVGMINSYPAGDWKFEAPAFALTAPVVKDIYGLCVGDVNGSYIPTGLKSASYLAPVDGGIQNVQAGESFTYNIRSNSTATLGAMTLFMNYDASLFEIEKVNTSLEGMRYVIENGQIALAWSDVQSLTVKTDDPIISLQIRAKSAIDVPTQIFSVNTGSEFADQFAGRYDNFELKMANVVTTESDVYLYNYPNPFQNTTDIVYTLPEQAKVTLVLTNMYGQTIRTLVDAEQSAGSYKVKVDPMTDNLKSGVYLYRIEVKGATATFTKTNKMMFTR